MGYIVEKVTPYCPAGHEPQPDYWTVRTSYLQKADGGPWPPMLKYETKEEAEALLAIMRCAHSDGQLYMKQAFRELMDIAEIDHEH